MRLLGLAHFTAALPVTGSEPWTASATHTTVQDADKGACGLFLCLPYCPFLIAVFHALIILHHDATRPPHKQ